MSMIKIVLVSAVMCFAGSAAVAAESPADEVKLASTVQVKPAPPQPSKPAGANVPATPAQRMYGDISPKLAELTDKVLYGDVWERPGLSKRDRSLVTVSALVAMNRPDQLRSHLRIARENGVTEAELVETITHLAFYSGWPNAVTAIAIAKEVFAKP
jgi:4-carboxymuconolactone decarboxylase